MFHLLFVEQVEAFIGARIDGFQRFQHRIEIMANILRTQIKFWHLISHKGRVTKRNHRHRLWRKRYPRVHAMSDEIQMSFDETHVCHTETRFVELTNSCSKKYRKFGDRKICAPKTSYQPNIIFSRSFFSFEIQTYFRLISRRTDDLCRFFLINDVEIYVILCAKFRRCDREHRRHFVRYVYIYMC